MADGFLMRKVDKFSNLRMPTAVDLLCYLCTFERSFLLGSDVDSSEQDNSSGAIGGRKESGFSQLTPSSTTTMATSASTAMSVVSPRPPVAKITRQESFKRAFECVSNKDDEAISVNIADNLKMLKVNGNRATSPVSVANYMSPVKQPGRGLKRLSSHDRLSGDDQQLEIAKQIAAFLELFQGDNEPGVIFNTDKIFAITLEKYVDRLIRLFNKWAEEANGPDSIGVRCAVLAVTYTKRARLILTPRTIHRCYLGAFLMAIKLIYDFYMSNNFWASVGSVTPKELNAIEAAYCDALSWNFGIASDVHELELAFYQAAAAKQSFKNH